MARPRAFAPTAPPLFSAVLAAVLTFAQALPLVAPPAAQAQLEWGVKPEQKAPSAADNAPDRIALDRVSAEAGKAMAAIPREALVKTMSKAGLGRARDQVRVLTPQPVE